MQGANLHFAMQGATQVFVTVNETIVRPGFTRAFVKNSDKKNWHALCTLIYVESLVLRIRHSIHGSLVRRISGAGHNFNCNLNDFARCAASPCRLWA